MHPKLLESTVAQCRAYIEAGDCHGEAPPTERLIAAVVQLADQQASAREQFVRETKLAIVGASAKLIDGFCAAIDTYGVPVASSASDQTRNKDSK
jgi:GAF domain-containing protein